MSLLLPDTHMLIWLAEDSREMPRAAKKLLQDEDHEVFFSLVSIWEISIKFALNRPDFRADPRTLRRGLLEIGFHELAIEPEHVIAVSRLPHHHRDPFDRLLVAQAETEGLMLMTTDKQLQPYGPNVRWFRQ